MPSTDELMVELEEAIHKILIVNNTLTKQNIELKNEITSLKETLSTTKKDLTILENKNKEMKIVSGLSGNTEHKRLMKHKLNSLIKEVDLCIAEVKKKSF